MVAVAGPRLHALLGPQGRAVPLGQQLDGVGPGVVQAPGELGSGIAQPDDQEVRRGAPALRPGKGAAQGLALFVRRIPMPAPRRPARRLPRPRLPRPRPRRDLFLHDDTRRLADGDGGLGVDFGRDARRQREVGHAHLPADGQLADVDLDARSGWRPAAR